MRFVALARGWNSGALLLCLSLTVSVVASPLSAVVCCMNQSKWRWERTDQVMSEKCLEIIQSLQLVNLRSSMWIFASVGF